MDAMPSPSSNTVRAVCPHCSKAMKVPAQYVGRTAKCAGCGEKILLAASSTTVAPKVEATPASPPPPPPAPVAPSRAPRDMAKVSGSFWLGVLVGGIAVGMIMTLGASSYWYLNPPAEVPTESAVAGEAVAPNADSLSPKQVAHAKKYATPEACYDAFIESIEENDNAAKLSCLAKKDRDIYVGRVAYQLQREAFMGMATDRAAEIEAKFKEQGIGGIDIMGALQVAGGPFGDIGHPRIMAVFEQVGAKVHDQAEFLSWVDTIYAEQNATVVDLNKDADGEGTSAQEVAQAKGVLRDVVIDGDTATGELRMDDGPRLQLHFARVDGGWLMGKGYLLDEGTEEGGEAEEEQPWSSRLQVAQEELRAIEADLMEEQLSLPGSDQRAVEVLQQFGEFRGMSRWPDPKSDGRGPTFVADSATFGNVHVRFLKELRFLESLDLENARMFGDEGMSQLHWLTSIRYLNLSGTSVTERGLGAIRMMTQLRELKLANTRVSDDIFALASRCSNLKLLDVSNTRVTQKGVDQFRAERPRCTVIFNGPAPGVRAIR